MLLPAVKSAGGCLLIVNKSAAVDMLHFRAMSGAELPATALQQGRAKCSAATLLLLQRRGQRCSDPRKQRSPRLGIIATVSKSCRGRERVTSQTLRAPGSVLQGCNERGTYRSQDRRDWQRPYPCSTLSSVLDRAKHYRPSCSHPS